MHRVLVIVVLICSQVAPSFAQSPTLEDKNATVAWVKSLQRESGGFRADAKPETPATLPATTSALRALKYFEGVGEGKFLAPKDAVDAPEPKEKAACRGFLKGCLDPVSGGFAAVPGGKPDARTTCLGVMAYREMGMLSARWREGEIDYLSENAKTFEEIRLAAAAYEALRTEPKFKEHRPKIAEEWIAFINRGRNEDGSYGKGGSMARDTGGAVVAVLRLGGLVPHKEKVVEVLKVGQRDDGGWTKEGDKSDLETTYRVMRAFVMLKEKPNVAACRKFIASCRNKDGSYSVQPGQPGNVSGTYFAGIISHWLDGMKDE